MNTADSKPLIAWETLSAERHLELREQYGHYLDGLPPTCSLETKIERFRSRVSVSFPPLPGVVKPGDTLYLNDGFIQLKVEEVLENDVHCRVVVGGEIRSRKGLNLPDVDLGISAFTCPLPVAEIAKRIRG